VQVDGDAEQLYRRLGFREQPIGMSRVIGHYLDNTPS
jgi:hypothetical protein